MSKKSQSGEKNKGDQFKYIIASSKMTNMIEFSINSERQSTPILLIVFAEGVVEEISSK